MDVILRQDVEKVGLRGDVVTVADGYARNYLIPRRLAERATPATVAEVRKREELRARQEARTAEQAEQIAEVLSKTVLRFEVHAGPRGRLFGSVTPTAIADEVWRTRKIRVDRRKIQLDPIKRIGRYDVPIEVFQDVVVEVKTLVVPEGGELPSEEELAAMEAEERAEEERAELEAAEAAGPAAQPPVRDSGPGEGVRGNREVPPTDDEAAEELQVPEDAFDQAAQPPVRDSGPGEGARGNREVPPADDEAAGREPEPEE